MKNYRVESEFTYRGLKCVVVMQVLGHRCGYVGIPQEHPLYGKKYGERLRAGSTLDVDDYFKVHGGLTYSEGSDNYPIPSDLWWFGFDCAHFGDRDDYEAAKKLFSDDSEAVRFLERREEEEREYIESFGEIRSLEYVEEQCKRLAEQLANFEEATNVSKAACEWISVNNRLPDEGQDVIFYAEHSEKRGMHDECELVYHCIYVGGYDKDAEAWFTYRVDESEEKITTEKRTSQRHQITITHWMPLPDPPQE